jgi:UDP-N-acetylmuramate: L-alanyl-gamma-D-glutamyl-meso-diaminopimelate ligase
VRIHILGICGTFMGGLAALAREQGHAVEGSDQGIYPPMSTQLAALGIALREAYRAEHLQPAPDLVLVGNALSRGNPAVEYLLEAGLCYVSGPQWLGESVLPGRRVLAVAGTHGKTTTTALLAHVLESAGRAPGFLVGGVPANFGVSARLGGGPDFVVEADEYDTAFFDKRSKFVHYRPRIAVLNNLEYDHADIFPDVAAIQRQFHHLVRIVPAGGRLVVNGEDDRLAAVLAMGCWTPVERFAIDRADVEWRAEPRAADGSAFVVHHRGVPVGEARWNLLGRHNVMNALAAVAAAHAAGVAVADALAALPSFASAKRRLETVGAANGITVYDDFAHHPTAIATTLAGLRARVGAARILVGMEPRSNSMRLGAHADELAPALRDADRVLFLQRPGLPWDAARVTGALDRRGGTASSVDELLAALAVEARAGDHVVFMSNGGFENAPARFAALIGAVAPGAPPNRSDVP